jgi:hypothetical protein
MRLIGPEKLFARFDANPPADSDSIARCQSRPRFLLLPPIVAVPFYREFGRRHRDSAELQLIPPAFVSVGGSLLAPCGQLNGESAAEMSRKKGHQKPPPSPCRQAPRHPRLAVLTTIANPKWVVDSDAGPRFRGRPLLFPVTTAQSGPQPGASPNRATGVGDGLDSER